MREAGCGCNPMIDNEVMLFPQPDSPTNPSVSPRCRSKLTPSAALPIPRCVKKYVRKSRTESMMLAPEPLIASSSYSLPLDGGGPGWGGSCHSSPHPDLPPPRGGRRPGNNRYRAYSCRSLGSRMSRNQSPTILNDNTTSIMAIPGQTDTHHSVSTYLRPSATIPPQVGAGGGIPAPRKLSDASTTMAQPTCSVESTTTLLLTLGNR